MFLLIPIVMLVLSFISFHIVMVCAAIMTVIELVMLHFFKSSLYVCLFLFLENMLIEEKSDPNLWHIMLSYVCLGAVLEIAKWLVTLMIRQRQEKSPGPVIGIPAQEGQGEQPISLVKNRKGIWAQP